MIVTSLLCSYVSHLGSCLKWWREKVPFSIYHNVLHFIHITHCIVVDIKVKTGSRTRIAHITIISICIVLITLLTMVWSETRRIYTNSIESAYSISFYRVTIFLFNLSLLAIRSDMWCWYYMASIIWFWKLFLCVLALKLWV